jgi:amidase
MTITQDQFQAFMPYPNNPVAHAAQGVLKGLTFGVKDLFDVAGYPTSAGQPHMLALSGIKSSTSPFVERFLDAGAQFVGKTVTDELAFSLNGQNAHFGAPVNGADPLRVSGGSSSGSASAVANKLCDFALGTDTGGSIRAPASHNGLFGLRPTHGRFDMSGSHALAPSLDAPGWFARDVAVFARVSELVLSESIQEQTARLVLGQEFWSLLTSDVQAAFKPALDALELAFGKIATSSVLNASFDELTLAFRQTQGWEAWQVNGEFIRRYQPMLGPGVAQRFEWSSQVTQQQYNQSQSAREKIKLHLTQVLGADGVLVLPTMPDCAPLVHQPEADLENYRAASLKLLSLAGLCGFPQVSLPLAHHQGAPLGISLLGLTHGDARLVGLAKQVAQVAGLVSESL